MSEILRVRKDREHPYTTVSKTMSEDATLSWAARGMMLYLLGKPDDWTVCISDLASQSPAGEQATRTILAELEEHGYVVRTKSKDDKGRWLWASEVHETPICRQSIPRPTTDGQVQDILNNDLLKNEHNLSTGVPVDKLAEEAKPAAPTPKQQEIRKRETTAWEKDRWTLGKYFAMCSRIPMPEHARYSELSVRWWDPLRRLYELSGNDMERAKVLVRRAVDYSKEQNFVLSSPQSVEKVGTWMATRIETKADGTPKMEQW